MNIEKLKTAEQAFFEKYPGGFENPIMLETGKKHRIGKLAARSREVFGEKRFENPIVITEDIIKTITSSSMVSVFEKPKFRDFVRGLSATEKAKLSSHMYQLLHKNKRKGFEDLVEFLLPAKQAKWTIMTVCPFYYKPNKEIFIKPTTTKGIIEYFEIKDLKYQPKPTWDFYQKYREIIITMKEKVNSLITPSNAAFTGFLMFAMNRV